MSYLQAAQSLGDIERRTEEEKSAMRVQRGRKRELRKIDRQMSRGKLSRASGQAKKASMYASDTNPLRQQSAADELEMRRQADAGRDKIQNNLEAVGKAALYTTAGLVGGPVGTVINVGMAGVEAEEAGEDGQKAMLKAGANALANKFGGQLLAKGEQAFLANRAMKEADRLSLAEMNFQDSVSEMTDDLAAGGDGSAFTDNIKTMGDRLVRRQERFDIAQAKANKGTTALGDLARGLNKTGLFNKLAQGNNIIQNDSGIDPQAAAVANPSGPAYTPQPDPFMVNTLYNPLPE